MVILRERAPEHDRAQRQRDPNQHQESWRALRLLVTEAPLQQRQRDRAEEHREQPRSALQEGEIGPLEVDLDVAGRQRPYCQNG